MTDPTSAHVVLRYVGDGELPISGTPLRDLTENDLARLAYERALAGVATQVGQPINPEDPEAGVYVRPDPRKPDETLVAAITGELLTGGQFAEAKSKAKGKAKDEPDTTDEPAASAETEG